MSNAFDAEWHARFERFGRTYEDEARISGWSVSGLERRVDLFRSVLTSLQLPGRALTIDLGCGAGTYVRLLAGEGHRAIGLDYSRPTLARAVAADPRRQGTYLAGDSYAMPFREATADLIVSIGVLQALGDPERALGEMARVLRPGGALVVEVLNSRALAARAHHLAAVCRRLPERVRVYDPRQVTRWLSDRGLEVARRVGLCLPPRQVPALARLLDLPAVSRAVQRSPALAEAAAHAFLFICRKRGPVSK